MSQRRARWRISVFPVVVLCLSVAALHSFAQSAPFDIVITHGRIIDGTGSPWFSGDIGIRSGKIAAIGNLAAAARRRTLDARGPSLRSRPDQHRNTARNPSQTRGEPI